MQVYKPLWEYITMPQFQTPPAPAREVVRKEVTSFWKRLHPTRLIKRDGRNQLCAIPPYLLNRAAPPPNLEQTVAALDQALEGWRFSKESSSVVKVVVGPPGSSMDQIVTCLAQKNNWQYIGPPTSQEILAGGDRWLENVTRDDITPLALPQLGKCYLRHQDGLVLMSRLLDWLQTTKRRCLLACDSWAWAYLSNALQIDVMLPTPLTLAPMDGARLQFWLPTLASAYRGKFVFRDVNDGRQLFTTLDNYAERIEQNAQEGQMERYGDWIGVNYYFKQLAAHSRGMPQVVWQLWRRSLQISHDVKDQVAHLKNRTGKDEFTVWVQPWNRLDLPVVPGATGTDETMVMHTILLHGGMTAPLLGYLLPLSHNQVRRVLHHLMALGLVDNEADGTWYVPLLAYPAVRQFMEHEGYLVDAF
ncbi:MAG TPA: hypothetical protein ENK32_12155 [Anaerolineae bacterium]|nr:hypothetical protein [Anaerolineae bacterium]